MQHLDFMLMFAILTVAVADDMYGYATTSWYLAESVSHIELNTEKMSEEEMTRVEEIANQKIREATPVHIKEFELSDPELEQVCISSVCSYDHDYYFYDKGNSLRVGKEFWKKLTKDNSDIAM